MSSARAITGLLLLLCSHTAFAEDSHQFYDEPQWVEYKKPDINQPIPVDRVKDGRHYLLVDNQIQVSKTGKVASYHHYAEYIVNQNGIKNSSQLSIDFDPVYQAIFVHKLQVWRKGRSIDKRSTARVTLIQPEREAKDLIYNGEQSLNIILDDIRVGDTIEFSYSRNGSNPVFDGVFDTQRTLQWSLPVGEIYQRIIWHKAKPLYFKRINTDVEVKQLRRGSVTEYIIAIKNMPAISLDDATPSWFSPYAHVYFSETKDWQDVVKWGRELFAHTTDRSDSIRQLADKIKSNHSDKSRQIAAALQYVQANVRYLGLELGENSHRPSSPGVTLQRRFGDCKDKSSLYIALLSELDITAYPVLVNTSQQLEIQKRLPAYGAFDHAIVKVVHDNKHYWFDPARQYQLGSVPDIYQPDYGYALVLKSGSESLESMRNLEPATSVVENDQFYVDIQQRDKVQYEIKTTYFGLEAEYQRDRIADMGMQKVQKNYLEFYKYYYPDIKTVNAAICKDKSDNGALICIEKYAITNFWKHDEKSNKFYADFYASSISAYLKAPTRKSRESPYKLSYPVSVEHNIAVNFAHDDWYFKKVSFNEDNDFFHYRSDVFYDKEKQQLQLKYVFKTKNSTVPVKRYKEYIALLKRARDDINYGIEYGESNISSNNTNSNNTNSNNTNSNNTNSNNTSSNITNQVDDGWLVENSWIIVLAIYGFLICLVFVLWFLADKKHSAHSDTQYYPVSVPKFMFMWVMTFGLYGMYWFYKNYAYIKRRDGSSIMPIARGIFNIFWYFSIYKDLTLHKINNAVKATIPPLYIGGIFAILFFISTLISNAGKEYIMLAFMLSGLLMVPMVNYIYHINDMNSDDSRYNSRLSFRHIVLIFINLPIVLLLIGSEIGLTASDKVVAGYKLYDHDLKYMQRKGILNPGDKVEYFYSDALLFIRDDGNGFTTRHVFSYYKEDGKLLAETASFDEIKNIDITWSKSFIDNTVINIMRKDGTEFLLYVSRINNKDKVFGRELKRRWQQVIKG